MILNGRDPQRRREALTFPSRPVTECNGEQGRQRDLRSLLQAGDRPRGENTPPVKLLDLEDSGRDYLHDLGRGIFLKPQKALSVKEKIHLYVLQLRPCSHQVTPQSGNRGRQASPLLDEKTVRAQEGTSLVQAPPREMRERPLSTVIGDAGSSHTVPTTVSLRQRSHQEQRSHLQTDRRRVGGGGRPRAAGGTQNDTAPWGCRLAVSPCTSSRTPTVLGKAFLHHVQGRHLDAPRERRPPGPSLRGHSTVQSCPAPSLLLVLRHSR